jgi:hypothetical protein
MQAILSGQKWRRILDQTCESPEYTVLSAELSNYLILCLEGDAMTPYTNGGVDQFTNRGIMMWLDIRAHHALSSTAGLVTAFSSFVQARMLPSETVPQY